MAHKTPLVSLHKLSVGYTMPSGRNILFEDLELTLNAGELTCFMGPNGVGKSTLIRTLAGLQKPLAGEVHPPEGPLPHQVAVVLTDRIATVQMDVRELVSFGRYPYMGWGITLSKDDQQKVNDALEEVHIQHLADKELYELSDGQQQMVMIARALAQDTPVVLLDEPTAHLDLNNRVEVMNLLRRLARKLNKAILIATHELDLALQTADLIWLAGRGKTLVTGIPEDLVLSGAFDEVFQFKGYDLKTGKVSHEAYRDKMISLHGDGHAYLWTRNALERNGFSVGPVSPSYPRVDVTEDRGRLHWTVDQKTSFDTLQSLLTHFI